MVLPAVMALTALGFLLALGFWQLDRRDWKIDLLARIDAASVAPPIPLADSPPSFAKVVMRGTLRPDLASRYSAEVRGGAIGARLLVPLIGDRSVLADLGWVADNTVPAIPPGEVTVTGFIRPPDQPNLLGRLVASPDQAAERRFYVLDPARIAQVIGLPLEPYVLVALEDGADVAPIAAPGVPRPAKTLPRPPNDHLSYAITWFGLAFCDALVFALYVRRRMS